MGIYDQYQLLRATPFHINLIYTRKASKLKLIIWHGRENEVCRCQSIHSVETTWRCNRSTPNRLKSVSHLVNLKLVEISNAQTNTPWKCMLHSFFRIRFQSSLTHSMRGEWRSTLRCALLIVGVVVEVIINNSDAIVTVEKLAFEFDVCDWYSNRAYRWNNKSFDTTHTRR